MNELTYGISLFLDEKFTDYITSIWKLCEEESVSSYMMNIDNITPHITLAGFTGIPEEVMRERFQELKQVSLSPCSLQFATLSAFKTTNVIHIQPNMSRQLQGYIDEVHKIFFEFKENRNLYYIPENWNPHVTISKGIDAKDTKRIFDFVIDNYEVTYGEVEGIELVRIDFDSEHKMSGCVVVDRIIFD